MILRGDQLSRRLIKHHLLTEEIIIHHSQMKVETFSKQIKRF
jgi:hypothetical protein